MAAADNRTSDQGRRAELDALVAPLRDQLDGSNAARERGLAASRRVIRASGSSIRAVHRRDDRAASALRAEAEVALREAQDALRPHPDVYFAGFLHDAAKEYAEACLTAAMVDGTPLPGHDVVGVEPPAWLHGLAEAASELRRQLLDRLRDGDLDDARRLLAAMDDAYDLLVTIDYPDAVVHGLRRSVDALRAVLERCRGDVTAAVVQHRLERAIDGTGPGPSSPT